MTTEPQHVYVVSEINDSVVRRTHGYFASLQGAFGYCETEERKKPLVDSARFELFAAPGGERWLIHCFYGPEDWHPVTSDFVIRQAAVVSDPVSSAVAQSAPADRAADVSSCPGRELDPNPCRCPCYGCKHHCAAHNPDDTDLTEADVDRMMAAGVPVQIVTAPPATFAASCPDPIECSHEAALGQAQAAVAELAQALRLTREYVGEELLPPIEGWSWYDALRRHAPHELAAVSSVGQAAHTTRGAEWRAVAVVVEAMNEGCGQAKPCASCDAHEDAANELRRMAAETQPAEAETRRACANCGHFTCNGNGPCGAIVSLSAVSDEKRCPCTGPAVGAQPPTEADGDRIVAYRSAGARVLRCLNCYPDETTFREGDLHPVTSQDLPDGGLCTKCGVDVLIPQQTTEA
jgi:hypothetical protein